MAPIEIEKRGGSKSDMWTSTERLYVNSDKSKVVPEGSPEAKFLLCPVGGQVSLADCERYGIGPNATATEDTTYATGSEEAETPTDTEAGEEGPQNGSQDDESDQEDQDSDSEPGTDGSTAASETGTAEDQSDKPRRRK